jgi:4-amino-4-deoxy-L-arabinose transferase-like glycosyltransferase
VGSNNKRRSVDLKHASRGSFNEATIGGATRGREVLLLLVLVALCLTLFFFRLGARPLWDVDEGMHAATSKDMVLSGDWITPKMNGENFYDKPILYNWFAALSFLIFGFTEFAARFPAAILGLGGVIITYLLGRKMFNPMVGFLGGVILATNVEYVILSRVVIHDISLCFFMTLALFFFYLGFSSVRLRKTYFLLSYASLGFAVLAKGPVGLLLPILIIGVFILLQRRLSLLKEMEIGWGLLILLLIATPWYLLISLKNRDYGGYFFIQQNLMRFLSPKAHHHQSFYYYFPVFFGGLFPWSCFLPLALIRALRWGFRERDDGVVFAVIWFVVIFVFFSMASSKLSSYILPLFPAASLLVGCLWHDLLKVPTAQLRKRVLYTFIFLLVVVPVVSLYIRINPPFRLESRYGVDLAKLNSLVLLATGGVAVGFGLFLIRNLKGSFAAMAGTVVTAILFLIVLMVPSVDPYRSTRGLAQKLDQMLPPGEKLVFFDSLKDSALFYTNRRALVLTTAQELEAYLASDKRVFCIVEKHALEDLEKIPKMPYIVGEEGGKLLVSNHKQ